MQAKIEHPIKTQLSSNLGPTDAFQRLLSSERGGGSITSWIGS